MRLCLVGDHVRSTSTGDQTYVQRRFSDSLNHRQLELADVRQRPNQLVDRGLAQLRIRRVRHLAIRKNLDAQTALGSQRQPIVGGLPIDQELRSPRIFVRNLRARRVSLFAHYK